MRTEEIDYCVSGLIPRNKADGVAIIDLARRGWRIGTIRNSLKRLREQGHVNRVWDGNGRYGRYLYFMS
jgi:hypothetical protein